MLGSVMLSQFVVSPGAGGLGAVIAALAVGGSALLVSRHRRREADREHTLEARKNALDHWWTRYVWLISTEGEHLPIEGRIQIVGHLTAEARLMNAEDLITSAEVYARVLERWLVEARRNAGQ